MISTARKRYAIEASSMQTIEDSACVRDSLSINPYAATVDYIIDYKIRMCVPNLRPLFSTRTLQYVY